MEACTQCENCADLTIEHLIDLAHEEFSQNDRVPSAACFELHDSIESLEIAADAGCEFCHFLAACLKGYPDNGNWIADAWQGEDCDLEHSLLSKARQLQHSEVRLCIVSDDSDPNDKLADVKVLDTLLVQIGPHDAVGEEMEDGMETFPVFKLTLATSRANAITLGRFRIGRYEVDGKVDAESNMEIAQEWLHTCETSHMDCLGTSIPDLPTRVIDVGTREDWADLRITQAREKKASYIVLSHCWGGPVAPMLTSRTIHIFQDQLPFSELAANFRDAITITRRLGFRYLWIDSLCIIQDSREDWTEESKKMGLIYRNSTLAISAMASKGSKHGIIPRNVQVELSLPAPAKVRVSKGSEDAITVLRQDFDEETLRILDIRSPVSNRAWCLQESLLSPRHLYYGRRQIYWRCPAGYQAADGTSAGLRVPEFTFPHVSAVLYRDIQRSQGEPLPSVRLLLQDYYTLVENYSQRRLTFSSDKLPAFSGVSGRIHPVIGGIYLAGLWTKDLAAGLLWQKEMRTCKHVEPYRAPSWSWAVTDESVLFYKKDALPESSVGITLVDYNVDLKDETNPYGEITSASITVRDLTLPLIRSRQHYQGYGQQYGQGSLFYDDDPRYADEILNMSEQRLSTAALLFTMEDDNGAYLLTITSSFPGIDCELEIEHGLFASDEYLALVVCVDEPEDDSIPTAKSVHGLAIKPIHDQGEDEDKMYERVGRFVIPTLEVSRLQNWATRTLTLV